MCPLEGDEEIHYLGVPLHIFVLLFFTKELKNWNIIMLCKQTHFKEMKYALTTGIPDTSNVCKQGDGIS